MNNKQWIEYYRFHPSEFDKLIEFAEANIARIAALEATLRNLLQIAEIAEYYLPGELAENAPKVNRDINHARALLEDK